MENGYSYGMNALISVDQLFNALTGGSCDETLSSRTNRMADEQRAGGKAGKGWIRFEKLINTLFFFDKGANGELHCELSYLVEKNRGHMPKTMMLKILKNEL